MNDERCEQVVSNAKYLQEVRPIDPEEIHEYVEGQPHPAAVRQVLRENAVELALIERADGTFVPVEDEPIASAFQGVSAFPERLGRRFEDLLVEEYGPGWPENAAGDRLRERIRSVKDDYLHQRDVEYDRTTALAYGIYHLPDYYAAAQYLLGDLCSEGVLTTELRVLDVGAGVGGPALGLADLLPADALLDYHAVEPSAAADVLETMLEETGRNVHDTIHRTTVEAYEPDGTFDLILFGNVLSELATPEAVVERLAGALAPDGSIVAMAPADRNTATNLRTVERAVADDGPLTVYAPTVRLWPDETPADEGWSFDVAPDLSVPGFQQRLDDAATDPDHEPGEFVNVDVQYAYTVLRADDRRRIEFTPDDGSVGKMSDAESHVTNRVDLCGIKLSHDLADGGHPLFRVGDGSQREDHFAVLTEESALNRGLLTAEYGDLLVFENVLVLWNDDEGAYNLVVDGETVVDRAAA